MCHGGVLYVMVMYCKLGRWTDCNGGVLYVRAVYYMLWRCTVCYGGVLCVTAVYCAPHRTVRHPTAQ